MLESQSRPSGKAKVLVNDNGVISFLFEGAQQAVPVVPELLEVDRAKFALWCCFDPEQPGFANEAWAEWSTFVASEVGQAIRWWSMTAFLRDGIRVKVEMR